MRIIRYEYRKIRFVADFLNVFDKLRLFNKGLNMIQQYRTFLNKLESVYGKCEAITHLMEGIDAIVTKESPVDESETPLQEGTAGKVLGGLALASTFATAGQVDQDKVDTTKYNDKYCTSQVVDEPMNLIKSGKYPEYANLVGKIMDEIKQKKPNMDEQFAYNLAGQRAIQILAQEQKTERCNAR